MFGLLIIYWFNINALVGYELMQLLVLYCEIT
jgi:hypothetical protein